MKNLITKLYANNQETFLNNKSRLNDFHNENCNEEDSTSKVDCFFLYLLALQFKPKCIFESGTWIGSTAKFLADAAMEYGGTVHTCDPYDKFVFSEKHKNNLIFHNKSSRDVIKEFKSQNKKIDFAFYDSPLDIYSLEGEITALIELASDDFVFSVHDYTESNGTISKGKWAIDTAWKILGNRGYQYYAPEVECYSSGHVNEINGCTGLLLPPSFK